MARGHQPEGVPKRAPEFKKAHKMSRERCGTCKELGEAPCGWEPGWVGEGEPGRHTKDEKRNGGKTR